MIGLMLVDDHTLFRKGIRSLIEDEGDEMCVVAEAGSGREALELYPQAKPDVVLLDLRMPDMDGHQTLTELLRLDPSARVVILSALDFDDQVRACMKAGAAGYLAKNLDPEELYRIVRAVHCGGIGLSAERLAQLVSGAPREPETCSVLSEREVEVVRLVAEGLTNREIANTLVVAPNTVKAHISNIMGKTGVHNRVELASWAMSVGIVAAPV